jgi:hypothetical protein
MGWTETIVMFVAGMGLSLSHLILARKSKKPLHVPLIPPTVFLFLGVLLIMIAGSHALTLLGIEHNRSQLRLH